MAVDDLADEVVRNLANAEGGHTFAPGSQMCSFCEIGLGPVRERARAGNPVPQCSARRPDVQHRIRGLAQAGRHRLPSGESRCADCGTDLALIPLGGAVPVCRTEVAAFVDDTKPDRRTGEERRGTSGNKYHRTIYGLKDAVADEGAVVVDVYSVLTAFAVTSPGLQHAAKKILCAGIRGKGDRVQDLTEARDALDRAIEDAQREAGR